MSRRPSLDPLVFLALGAALLGAVSAATSGRGSDAVVPASSPALRYEVPCPPGQLPDEGICVPVSPPGENLEEPSPGTAPEAMVPLRVDRPRAHDGYLLPLTLPPGVPPTVMREEPTSDIGPALRFALPAAPVRSVQLEGQDGATEVVFATHGPPGLVITAHRVQRERGTLTFLLVHGHLAEIEASLLESMPTAPLELAPGANLGKTGASGLLLGLRQVRRDVTLEQAVPDLAPEMVFASDPRNALALRP